VNYELTPIDPLDEWLRSETFALRYQAMLHSDASPGPGPHLRDRYDELPGNITFALRDAHGDLIGSIRASVHAAQYGWRPIPAFDCYGDDLEALYGREATLAQATHLVISPRWRQVDPRPKFLLMKATVEVALAAGAVTILATVRNSPAYRRFYGRLGFEPVAGARLHPVSRRECVLLAVAPALIWEVLSAEHAFRPEREAVA
jgi:hypothetical protein